MIPEIVRVSMNLGELFLALGCSTAVGVALGKFLSRGAR